MKMPKFVVMARVGCWRFPEHWSACARPRPRGIYRQRAPRTLAMSRKLSAKRKPLLTISLQMNNKPILFVDVDGVISLFGFARDTRPEGSFHTVDGIPHLLSA